MANSDSRMVSAEAVIFPALTGGLFGLCLEQQMFRKPFLHTEDRLDRPCLRLMATGLNSAVV